MCQGETLNKSTKHFAKKIWNGTAASDLHTRLGLHTIVAVTSNLKSLLNDSYLKKFSSILQNHLKYKLLLLLEV